MASIIGTTGAQNSAVVAGNIAVALSSTVLTIFSKELLFYALPNFRYMQFARTKTELSAEKGDRVRMHRVNPIRKGKKLLEGVPIEPKTLDMTTQDITVDEFGNAVEVTERLLRTSAFQQMMIAAKNLGDDYALTTEVDLLLTLDSLPSVLYANEKANRAALVLGDTMSARTIRAAVERMKNAKVPSIVLTDEQTGAAAAVYVCFLNPHQARGMREDADWKDAVKYNNARRIFLGEIGMYEMVVFIETTMQPVIRKAGGADAGHYYIDNTDMSSSAVVDDPITPDPSPHATLDVHKAFLIGDYCYGFAEALPVEMRDEPPKDLGRIRKIGWYSIQGSDLINAAHGLIIETT